ncbi:hypothetical protein PR048_025072 [Dryococelus australis]|uniref:Uncharacterized protein n=1 Tax=Dryococelus australis TaxID=614101 RepID=A0ABQ9GQD7_9NEOP|nr:hypothetical protein PR048_025072 [Dryococelus australis]
MRLDCRQTRCESQEEGTCSLDRSYFNCNPPRYRFEENLATAMRMRLQQHRSSLIRVSLRFGGTANYLLLAGNKKLAFLLSPPRTHARVDGSEDCAFRFPVNVAGTEPCSHLYNPDDVAEKVFSTLRRTTWGHDHKTRAMAKKKSIPPPPNPTKMGLTPVPLTLSRHVEDSGGVVVRLLASHKGEPGSIPSGVTPKSFARGYRAGQCRWFGGFSAGIARFCRPCIPVLFHIYLASPSSALKPSMLRDQPKLATDLYKKQQALQLDASFLTRFSMPCHNTPRLLNKPPPPPHPTSSIRMAHSQSTTQPNRRLRSGSFRLLFARLLRASTSLNPRRGKDMGGGGTKHGPYGIEKKTGGGQGGKEEGPRGTDAGRDDKEQQGRTRTRTFTRMKGGARGNATKISSRRSLPSDSPPLDETELKWFGLEREGERQREREGESCERIPASYTCHVCRAQRKGKRATKEQKNRAEDEHRRPGRWQTIPLVPICILRRLNLHPPIQGPRHWQDVALTASHHKGGRDGIKGISARCEPINDRPLCAREKGKRSTSRLVYYKMPSLLAFLLLWSFQAIVFDANVKRPKEPLADGSRRPGMMFWACKAGDTVFGHVAYMLADYDRVNKVYASVGKRVADRFVSVLGYRVRAVPGANQMEGTPALCRSLPLRRVGPRRQTASRGNVTTSQLCSEEPCRSRYALPTTETSTKPLEIGPVCNDVDRARSKDDTATWNKRGNNRRPVSTIRKLVTSRETTNAASILESDNCSSA